MKKNIICLTILLGSASLLYAQTNDSISTDLNDVVVVASRKPTKISDLAGTVWVINQEQIAQQAKNGVPLKEALAIMIPGMDVGSQGRSNYGQNMRGRSMLVMIDGVSLNSIRNISRQLDAIDPFNIERVEVLSGASAIYGGNATGGIVNIVTKKALKNGISGETELGLRTGFSGSDDHDWRVAQSIGYKNDKFTGRLAVAFQQNGGAYDADGDQIFADISQLDLQYNQSIDVLATAGYKFNPKHQINGSVQYYRSKYSGDRSLYLGENISVLTKGDASVLEMRDGFDTDKNPGTERVMGTLSYNGTNILGGQDVYVQFASRVEKLGFYPFPGNLTLPSGTSPYMSASQQDTYYSGLKAVLVKDWGKLKLTYGADVDFEKFEGQQNVFDSQKSLSSGGMINHTVLTIDRYPTNHSSSFAGYAQAEYNILPQLKVSGGIRYQDISIKLDDFIGSTQQLQIANGYGNSADNIPGGKSSYNMTMLNAGLLYKINELNQVWTTYSQGVSLADPSKFYGYGNYKFNSATNNWDLSSSVNVKDSPLSGVKTGQLELGYRFRTNNGFKGQISGFISNSDKNIALKRDGLNLWVEVVDQKLRNMGVEAEVSYTNGGFYVGANTLLIKSEVEKNGDWQKQDVSTSGPSKFTAYAGYGFDNWNFRFQTLQSFKYTDGLENVIDSYNTSDLMVAYKLPFGKINLGVQNIFNSDYQTIWSAKSQVLYSAYKVPELFYYAGRGRTFNLSFTYNF